eukprot:13755347-Alexandrium_andersonii.AAC.1
MATPNKQLSRSKKGCSLRVELACLDSAGRGIWRTARAHASPGTPRTRVILDTFGVTYIPAS